MLYLPMFSTSSEEQYYNLLRVMSGLKVMHFNEFPLEIIQQVFSLCCWRGVEFTIPPPDRIQSGTTHVTLSLVCSRWRAIALNTRMLWGDVMVYYNGDEESAQGSSDSFQFVQNWLKRAGTTPISLSIFSPYALESEVAAISQALLSSFHFTNLDLESVGCHYLLPPTNNSYYLERLYLTLNDLVQVIDTFPRLPEMPSLKELQLCLDLDFFEDLTNVYLIPWHQLHIFTLHDYSWSSNVLLNILQRCKSLVDCTLVVELQHRQHEHGIVLPNLESLELEIASRASADPFILSLTLPNLRSLDIRAPIEVTELSLSTEAIIIMAQRSGFNKRLTHFSLSLMEQPIDVRLLLRNMPALESLQLMEPLMFQPGTFDDLSSGRIGPRLEEIWFGVMSDEEIGLLLETVGQRHKKAKTVSDIRPFAVITCFTESQLESHERRAKQCSDAFGANVAILSLADSSETDSDE